MNFLIFVAAIFSFCWRVISKDVVNIDVQRNFDASSSGLKVSTKLKVSNIKRFYEILFLTSTINNLAFITINSKSENIPIHSISTKGNITVYLIELEGALISSETIIDIEAVYTGLYEPYPVEITQFETQLIRFHDNHYFLSAYNTLTQKTTVKLSTGSSVESFTKLPPHNVKGNIIVFGPYQSVEPFSVSPMTVHFSYNKPLARLSTVHREVEVSHWGRVSVEEVVELQHAGAQLKGGFSRYEYFVRGQNEPGQSASFDHLTALLPAPAGEIYYRDQIGNISTSALRKTKKGIELDTYTRFPIFGGWQIQFYVGYVLPAQSVLSIISDSLPTNDTRQSNSEPKKSWPVWDTRAWTGDQTVELSFDLNTMFRSSAVWVESMETKFILPEGARDILVTSAHPVEQRDSRRYTYLDSILSGGRPVVILKARNLVERHTGRAKIRYTLARSRLLVELGVLIGTVFVTFILFVALGRLRGPRSNSVC